MAIKKIKLPGMLQPVDIGTTWTNISGKPDLITSDEATAYMQKGVDYVTAGQKTGETLGLQATAEGYQTIASGDNSHAEGQYTEATGKNSHAEGAYSQAGYYKKILSQVSFSESVGTETFFYLRPVDNENDSYPFNRGSCSIEYNNQQYQGTYIKGYADESVYIVVTISNENLNIPINDQVYIIIDGYNSHAEGNGAQAFGYVSHAEGYQTTASGSYSHAEGNRTIADGNYSHAEGNNTTASGDYSHAEGNNTTASSYSHAEGNTTTASGYNSHAEGNNTTAFGSSSHAEGNTTTASGYTSHAEGYRTAASGEGSHTEGSGTIASGYNSHAEGVASAFIPMGFAGNVPKLSKVEGQTPYQYQLSRGTIDSETGAICVNNKLYVITAIDSTGKIITLDRALPEEESLKVTYRIINPVISSGPASHAEGIGTIANHASQHVFGVYNIADDSAATTDNKGNYVEIVGNGTNATRSNARTLDWSGNEVLAGKLTVGAAPTENMDVATKQYVDNIVTTNANAALPMTGGAMSGDIAMGNHKVTNLANGEVVTDAATVGQLISLIQHQTATIGTDATSAVINLGSAYTCINAYATIGNERVLVDIEVNEANGIVTFSTAQEPPSAITCHVFYFLSVLPTTTTIPDPSGGEIIAGD